jgi:isocitrate dehydrogenase
VAATQLLVHVGQSDVAGTIKNAWLRTLEDGVHTGDVYSERTSSRRVGTEGFADAVIERLGQQPATLEPVQYAGRIGRTAVTPTEPRRKELVGVDAFLDWSAEGRDPQVLGPQVEQVLPDGWRLKMITNRGVKVYPDGLSTTFCTDHWRCRLVPEGGTTTGAQVVAVLGALVDGASTSSRPSTSTRSTASRATRSGQGE